MVHLHIVKLWRPKTVARFVSTDHVNLQVITNLRYDWAQGSLARVNEEGGYVGGGGGAVSCVVVVE